MRKILITGGAGFVGRHFCEHFLHCGDEVHCVDSLVPHTGAQGPTSWYFSPKGPRFHFQNQDCRQWFHDHADVDDIDYVFHLAAMVGGRLMIENHPLAVADDLAIDAAYWQWAEKARPRKTVAFSSCAAYPLKFQTIENSTLLTESMIDFKSDLGVPDLTYGWAKLTNEFLAQLAAQRHGLDSAVYRPFSGYGADQDLTYPFPAILQRVRALENSQSPFIVWGTGNQRRDFIHIDDIVRGVIHTMDDLHGGQAMNLSTGIGTSFKEFARLAVRLRGFWPEIVGAAEKPEGPFARVGDTTLQHQMGFVHKISLSHGIEQAMRRVE